MRGRIAWAVGIFPAIWLKEGAGAYAARVSFERGSDEAFALLERLLEVGSSPRRTANGSENGLEAASLANPVPSSSQLRVAAAISELRRHAQVPDGEDRGQGGDHNGDGGHLARGDRRQDDEEDVENHGPDHSGPEGEAQTADHSHETESSVLNAG
jgi:hypothetical protein